MSADGARQFLDTNILVYTYDSSASEKHDQALGPIWSENFAAGRRYDGIEIRSPFLQ